MSFFLDPRAAELLALVDAGDTTMLQDRLQRAPPDFAAQVLQAEVDPNTADTLLHRAVSGSSDDAVALLLQYRARPNQLNARQQTALHVAARNGELSKAKLLVCYGAADHTLHGLASQSAL